MDLIENLPNHGTKNLLIFDIFCKEASNSQQFVKVAAAGRHRGLNTIYNKHSLLYQSNLGRDMELQNTQIVQVPERCYTNQYIKSTSTSRISIKRMVSRRNISSYGILLIDLAPRLVDSLCSCSNSGSFPTKSYLPAAVETKFLDDEYTIRLYSPNISKIFHKTSKTIQSLLSKNFHSVSERMFSKPIRRRASRSSEKIRSEILKKKYFRVNTKKILYTKEQLF